MSVCALKGSALLQVLSYFKHDMIAVILRNSPAQKIQLRFSFGTEN